MDGKTPTRTNMTDWKIWMDACDLGSADEFMEISSLYHAINDKDSGYGYEVAEKGDVLTLSPYDQSLPSLSLSEEAKAQMLASLDEKYGMPIDAYEVFLHAMEKDD